MAKTVPLSVRLEPQTDQLLRQVAEREDRSLSAIAQRFIEEGARAQRFPGIDFRERAGRRRAYLQGAGVDVWQVVAQLKGGVSAEELVEHSSLDQAQIELARSYYEHYREEIDELIEDNLLDPEQVGMLYPGLRISESTF